MRAAALLAVALAFTACSTPLAQRAQRADGLLDFLAGNPGEVAIPVEASDSGRGRIETAHLRVHGSAVYVTGYVSRASLGDPHPAAHVDVLVVDARHRVVETKLANYLPRSIPHGQRGGFAHSRFTARLAAKPPQGATVKVTFHDGSARTCDFNPAFAAR